MHICLFRIGDSNIIYEVSKKVKFIPTRIIIKTLFMDKNIPLKIQFNYH